MTERQRLRRARMLFKHRGIPRAAAWRKVNPGTRASDKSAAEMCVRELSWFRQWLVEHPGEVRWRQEPKRCIGVDDRPCGKEIPRRQKRCKACADKQKLLKQPGYGLNYYRSHRELANAKRNERRGRQHQREREAATAAAEQKKREHRAKVPRLVEYNGREYLHYPETGEWKMSYRDFYDQVGRFVPVPPGYPVPLVPQGVPVPAGDWRQREASQPGSAPRADRLSSKQQDLPASSGKNRKAAANGASPKPRCKICAHPDRAAIDAELVQGLSIPTIAGRYGLSVSTLYRHRKWHVDAPTVGDILAPRDRDDVWREWSGTEWRPIDLPLPFRKYFVEVRGRPNDVRWREGYDHFFFTRKVYRRRRSRQLPASPYTRAPRRRFVVQIGRFHAPRRSKVY